MQVCLISQAVLGGIRAEDCEAESEFQRNPDSGRIEAAASSRAQQDG